ncbi:hypothetical protein DPX39_080043800 [Trypanosoma brucei equiperdum]|uniref:Uncharacterized protein n=1 Tax=Trypanosoma brucei equiperdum TaxID=630700 RepID=A0A3L6L2L5_9TRYP|nr:hypothetical protein DPX39_080043800 [Trypanosoma brucei equiperdum]
MLDLFASLVEQHFMCRFPTRSHWPGPHRHSSGDKMIEESNNKSKTKKEEMLEPKRPDKEGSSSALFPVDMLELTQGTTVRSSTLPIMQQMQQSSFSWSQLPNFVGDTDSPCKQSPSIRWDWSAARTAAERAPQKTNTQGLRECKQLQPQGEGHFSSVIHHRQGNHSLHLTVHHGWHSAVTTARANIRQEQTNVPQGLLMYRAPPCTSFFPQFESVVNSTTHGDMDFSTSIPQLGPLQDGLGSVTDPTLYSTHEQMMNSETCHSRTVGYITLGSNDTNRKYGDEDASKQYIGIGSEVVIPTVVPNTIESLQGTTNTIKEGTLLQSSRLICLEDSGYGGGEAQEIPLKHVNSPRRRRTAECTYCLYERPLHCDARDGSDEYRPEFYVGLDDDYHQDYKVFDALSIVTTSSCCFGMGMKGLKPPETSENVQRFLTLINRCSSTDGDSDGEREVTVVTDGGEADPAFPVEFLTMSHKEEAPLQLLPSSSTTDSKHVSFARIGNAKPPASYAFEEFVYAEKLKAKQENSLAVSKHIKEARAAYDISNQVPAHDAPLVFGNYPTVTRGTARMSHGGCSQHMWTRNQGSDEVASPHFWRRGSDEAGEQRREIHTFVRRWLEEVHEATVVTQHKG